MRCDEKATLLRAYELASEAYSKAVANLSGSVGAVLYAEYQMVQRKVALLREVANEARKRLDDHKRQHNC